MEIAFKPAFLRQLKKLPEGLQEETKEKIQLFRNLDNHKKLKVHKLRGSLAGRYSFSVNYRMRIVFRWEKFDELAVLTGIGNHSVYE